MKTIYTALVALALFVPSAKVVTAAEDIDVIVAATIYIYSTECGSIGPIKQRILDMAKSHHDATNDQVTGAILGTAVKMAQVGKSAWCADYQDVMQK